jgi:hypothetical protein
MVVETPLCTKTVARDAVVSKVERATHLVNYTVNYKIALAAT